MKIRIVVLLAALALLANVSSVFAAEQSEVSTQLKELVSKLQTKIKKEGKPTEADLADDLKQFDALYEKHKSEKTDDVASILFMKAMLYAQVFHKNDKAVALLEQVKTEYPDTKLGKNADQTISMIKQQAESQKLKDTLAVGTKFPDFDEKDVKGKPVSIANYKGKIVLLDFWATWCGPCVHELPNVQKTYEKHHPQGFEIIGISLDQDEKKLNNFIEDKKMPWQQFFDGNGWSNKLAKKYGIQSIPATYLLDGEGKIIGTDLRDEELEKAVSAALAKK